MITNHARTVINSFEKLKLPTKEAKPTGSGMMSRSRPPVQQMSGMKKQPAIIAREIQMQIRNTNKAQKNGGTDDGTVV